MRKFGPEATVIKTYKKSLVLKTCIFSLICDCAVFASRTWCCCKLQILKLAKSYHFFCFLLFLFFFSPPGQIYIWMMPTSPEGNRGAPRTNSLGNPRHTSVRDIWESSNGAVPLWVHEMEMQPLRSHKPVARNSCHACWNCRLWRDPGHTAQPAAAFTIGDGWGSEENRDSKGQRSFQAKAVRWPCWQERQSSPLEELRECRGCEHGRWRPMHRFHVCWSLASVLYTGTILVPIS